MSGPYRSADDPGRAQPSDDAITTWQSSHACPDCSQNKQVRLFAACRKGVVLEACGRCGGVWIDRAQAKTLFEDGTGAGVASELASLADRIDPPPPRTHERRCVVCHAPLARRALYAIAIDACAAHGIWFDRGEVRAVVAKMTAATFDAETPRVDAGSDDELAARGRLNGLLRSLAKDFIAG